MQIFNLSQYNFSKVVIESQNIRPDSKFTSRYFKCKDDAYTGLKTKAKTNFLIKVSKMMEIDYHKQSIPQLKH